LFDCIENINISNNSNYSDGYGGTDGSINFVGFGGSNVSNSYVGFLLKTSYG